MVAPLISIIQPVFNYVGGLFGVYKWFEFYLYKGNYASEVMGLCGDGSTLKTAVPDFCNATTK